MPAPNPKPRPEAPALGSNGHDPACNRAHAEALRAGKRLRFSCRCDPWRPLEPWNLAKARRVVALYLSREAQTFGMERAHTPFQIAGLNLYWGVEFNEPLASLGERGLDFTLATLKPSEAPKLALRVLNLEPLSDYEQGRLRLLARDGPLTAAPGDDRMLRLGLVLGNAPGGQVAPEAIDLPGWLAPLMFDPLGNFALPTRSTLD